MGVAEKILIGFILCIIPFIAFFAGVLRGRKLADKMWRRAMTEVFDNHAYKVLEGDDGQTDAKDSSYVN